MDVIEMNKLEDILSAIEYNGGGHRKPSKQCAAQCGKRG